MTAILAYLLSMVIGVGIPVLVVLAIVVRIEHDFRSMERKSKKASSIVK